MIYDRLSIILLSLIIVAKFVCTTSSFYRKSALFSLGLIDGVVESTKGLCLEEAITNSTSIKYQSLSQIYNTSDSIDSYHLVATKELDLVPEIITVSPEKTISIYSEAVLAEHQQPKESILSFEQAFVNKSDSIFVSSQENTHNLDLSVQSSFIDIDTTQLAVGTNKLSKAKVSSLSKLKNKTSVAMLALGTQNAVKLVVYYLLFYFFTVVYNVANKKVLEAVPLPASIATAQLFIGIPMFLPAWLLKPPRNMHKLNLKSNSIIAFCHGFGNLATVYALNAGSVSFTHMIKSAEPIFSAILSILVTNTKLSIWAYLSLVPIVCGVALASVKEFNFSWFVFITAMISNLLYQLRMVLSKVLIGSGAEDTTISAANTFRVITIASTLQLIPIAIILEYGKLQSILKELSNNPLQANYVFINLLISGATYYLYNEIGFWILELVHPVTHAVGNTIKRVVLILASILILQNQVNLIGLFGTAVAIGGSFLYALAQTSDSSKAKAKAICNDDACSIGIYSAKDESQQV